MRTLIYLKIGLVIGLISFTKHLNSQSTSNNNNPGVGKFLGYNAAGLPMARA